MGEGFKLGSGCLFKAFVDVTTNPNVTVTATGRSKGKIYTAIADEFGKARLTIKKKDVYDVSTSAGYRSVASVTKSGQTYPVTAVKVGSISGLSSAGWESRTVCIHWKNPAAYFTGVIVRYATGSAPTSTTAGTQAYSGVGGSLRLTTSNTVNGFTLSGLNIGVTYYFTVFPYYTLNGTTYYGEKQSISWDSKKYIINSAAYTGNWSAATIVEGGCALYSNGVFTIPEGVRSIDVFAVGGGGGGGGTVTSYPGSGGAGGFTNMKLKITVIPGQTFTVNIGAGGKAGSGVYATDGQHYTQAQPGGATSFGNLVTANGGGKGYCGGTNYGAEGIRAGGNGGSGGGGPQIYGSSGSVLRAGSGGANGGSGGDSSNGDKGGTGQGRSTRAWESPSGTLYSGGGGGGVGSTSTAPGNGGAGGGGNGGSFQVNGTAATFYGGGGGGAGAGVRQRKPPIYGGDGYSGICLVRVSV